MSVKTRGGFSKSSASQSSTDKTSTSAGCQMVLLVGFSPGDHLRHENKIRSSTTTGGHVTEAHGWFEGSWYYVSIPFGGSQMGVLMATDNTDRAGQKTG